MPELPDVEIYCEALRNRIVDQPLEAFRLMNPFLLRTVEPPVESLLVQRIVAVRRLGKRIVLGFENGCFAVFHLMISGRFRWSATPPHGAGKINLAAMTFPTGTLIMTEAGTKKRSSLHIEADEEALRRHDRGGLDVLEATPDAFQARLQSENHTLKRALTDPRLYSGIGNAYSDEILHAARLSPLKLTRRLSGEEVDRLFHATNSTLKEWTQRLREQFGDRFPGPGQVTAFREGFAVHGRYKMQCPVCSSPVQRIRYAENETNYCPTCQTGGRILADRSLSRLLKEDWPRSLDALEDALGEARASGNSE